MFVTISERIIDMALRREREAPGQMALIDPKANATLSFAELPKKIIDSARALYLGGIRPGMRVCVMVPPSIDFFLITYGLFALGATPVFIDPGMGLANIKSCAHTARVRAFIGVPKAHIARLLFNLAPLAKNTLITVGDSPIWGTRSYKSLLAASASGVIWPFKPNPDQVCAILFTSGSTGSPKGAMYFHRHFMAQLDLLKDSLGIVEGEIDLCTFALFALFGPALGMTGIIAPIDFSRPKDADPKLLFDMIARYRVENLFGSPGLLTPFAAYGQKHKGDLEQTGKLATLKRICTAGAPVPYQLLNELDELIPDEATIYTPYGATEALPIAVMGHRDIKRYGVSKTKDGQGICVGKLALDTKCYIWEPQTTEGRGLIGEICVSGPQVTEKYCNPLTGEAFGSHEGKVVKDGVVVHRTGDLGYFDEQGYLFYCGRVSERVGADGYTVCYEAMMNEYPGVHRCALVAGKGSGQDADIEKILIVELKKFPWWPFTYMAWLKSLRQFVRQHPRLKDVARVLIIRRLPVDARHNAKINRKALQKWLKWRLLWFV